MGIISQSTKVEIQAELDTHISNEIGDSEYDLVNQKVLKRVPLQSIVMYEVEAPLKVSFEKNSQKESAICFNAKDEESVNNMLEMLNDLVPGKESTSIYNLYKSNEVIYNSFSVLLAKLEHALKNLKKNKSLHCII